MQMKMVKEVTVLCCYNNIKQFQTLVACLEKKIEKVEIIGIDNSYQTFQSCAEAFNAYLDEVNTEYIVFCHQDIILENEESIEEFLRAMKTIGKFDILGVAGRKQGDKTVITNVRHGTNQCFAGGKRIDGISECETIDECFFGGSTECFKTYPFNQIICNNWHLYAVERSLAALERGNKVYVCGIPLIHLSKGKMNSIYNKQFYLISKRYSKNIEYLLTTCACANTRFPFRELAYIKRKISMILGRY